MDGPRTTRTTRTVRHIYSSDDRDDYDHDYNSRLDDRDFRRYDRHYDQDHDDRMTVRERSRIRDASGRDIRDETVEITRRGGQGYDRYRDEREVFDDDWDRRSRISTLQPREFQPRSRISERFSSPPQSVVDDRYHNRSPSGGRQEIRITKTVSNHDDSHHPGRRDSSNVSEKVTITERRYDDDDHYDDRRNYDRHYRDNDSNYDQRSHHPHDRSASQVTEKIKITESHGRDSPNFDVKEKVRITERHRRASSPERVVEEIKITKHNTRERSSSSSREDVRIDDRHRSDRSDIHITESHRSHHSHHSRSPSHSPSRSPPRSPSPDRAPKDIKITETHHHPDGTSSRKELKIQENVGSHRGGGSSYRGGGASTRDVRSEKSFSPTRSVKSVKITATVEKDRSSVHSNDSRSSHNSISSEVQKNYDIERYVRNTESAQEAPYTAYPAPIVIRSDTPPAPQPIIIKQEPLIIQRTEYIDAERKHHHHKQAGALVRREPDGHEEDEDYYYEKQVRRNDHPSYSHDNLAVVRREQELALRRRSHSRPRIYDNYSDDEEDVIVRRRIRKIKRSPSRRRSRSRSRSRSTSPASRRRHLLEGAVGGAAIGELVRRTRRKSGVEQGNHAGQLVGYGALGAAGAEAVERYKQYRHRSKSRARHNHDDYYDRSRSRSRSRRKSIGTREALTGVAGIAAIAGIGAIAYAAGKRKSKSTEREQRGRSETRPGSVIYDDNQRASDDTRSSGNRIAQAGVVGGALAALGTSVSGRSKSRHGKESRSKSAVRKAVPIAAAAGASAAAAGLIERHRSNKDKRGRSHSRARSDDELSGVQYGSSEIPTEEDARNANNHHGYSPGISPTPYGRDQRGSDLAMSNGIAGMDNDQALNLREQRRAERERRRAARAAQENPMNSPMGPLNQNPNAPIPAPIYSTEQGFIPPPPPAPPGFQGPSPMAAYNPEPYNPEPYNPAQFGAVRGPTLPTDDIPPPPAPPPQQRAANANFTEPSPGTVLPSQEHPPQMLDPDMRAERREMYGLNSHNNHPNVSENLLLPSNENLLLFSPAPNNLTTHSHHTKDSYFPPSLTNTNSTSTPNTSHPQSPIETKQNPVSIDSDQSWHVVDVDVDNNTKTNTSTNANTINNADTNNLDTQNESKPKVRDDSVASAIERLIRQHVHQSPPPGTQQNAQSPKNGGWAWEWT